MRRVFVGGPIQHAMCEGRYDERYRAPIVELIRRLRLVPYEVRAALEEGYLEGWEVHVGAADAVARDYGNVTASDAYVCIWPPSREGESYRSDGTCVELGWASGARIPCVIVRDLTLEASDMITGLSAITKATHVDYHACVASPQLLLAGLSRVLGSREEETGDS